MSSEPFVTLIMPVRNEASFITISLGSIFNQDYTSSKMEIIIADGISQDNTREIINNLCNGNERFSCKVLDNPKKIVPTGLNIALNEARGNIIIRVDGHCEIAKDYVRYCVGNILKNNVDGVGGPIETIGDTALSKAIAIGMSSFFGVGGSAFRIIKDKAMLVDTVPFPAYTREIITKAGPFDEELVRNQDDEYNYRIRKLGGKILLAPDIRSKYYSRTSMRKLWSQYFQYGFWKVRVLQKHPRQMRLRQFVPPSFVASLITTFILAFFTGWGKDLFVVIAGGYILANILASIITASKKGWRNLPLLPIVFVALHLSYGSGFLVGLVRFAHRWRDKDIHQRGTESAEK